jgi:hypothetical protein
MKYNPYMPVAIPDIIEFGPYKNSYAVRYRDEHGLLQTHFPFLNSEIAWAYAMSVRAKHLKIPLTPISLHRLKVNDIFIDKYYQPKQITELPIVRCNIFGDDVYAAQAVFIKAMPNPSVSILVTEAFKLPIDNADFII